MATRAEKSWKPRFLLTTKEKQVVVFVLAAFVLGLTTKFYRETHPIDTSSSNPKKQRAHQTTRPRKNAPTPGPTPAPDGAGD